MKHIFDKADILIPTVADPSAYSVVACDQYTSEPEYFQRIEKSIGDRPSTLKMVFPEAFLKTADFDKTISDINKTMQEYLDSEVFYEHKDCFIYVVRKLKNGAVRQGLVGMVDLEEYDFSVGSKSKIRATEGTVLDRIPPRVKIRENAPIELPHIMLLIDDEKKEIIESLELKSQSMEKLYDFELMEDSGHITGYKLDGEQADGVLFALDKLSDKGLFEEKYGIKNTSILTFAVGDGNHSLATARQCYLNLKSQIGEAKARLHPARYALCELVNLHDSSLEFEAIHRILFNISKKDFLAALNSKFSLSDKKEEGSQHIVLVENGERKSLYIKNPCHTLAVGSLQIFIDEYLKAHGGEVDYIHGEEVVLSLSRGDDCVGFLLEPMQKNELFKSVISDGALPRKTFSMGNACDKRFYLEGRKIK